MQRWILVGALLLSVGCTTTQWQGAGRAFAGSLETSMQGLSVALRESGTQKIVDAFNYTGNHHAEYIRNKQLNRNRAAMIAGYCLTNPMVSNRSEYDSCLFANGIY